MNRRSFLTQAAAFGAAPLLAGNTPVHTPKGKAEHCIFIWLGGGMAQIDTFDPKKLGEALAYLESGLRNRGLSLKRKMCVVWGPAAGRVPHPEDVPTVPWEPDSGITLLGVPIPFPGSKGHLSKE